MNVSKRTSNFGVLSELGRSPKSYNILVAIYNYRTRLETFDKDDLLYDALQSQKQLAYNSYIYYKTSTFTQIRHADK